MSKRANPGELRTKVYFKRTERGRDGDGYPTETIVNAYGTDGEGNDVPAMCKWVNIHGNAAWEVVELKLREPATITTRYSPLIDDIKLAVYRENDPDPYEIISINNVEMRGAWLEFKVQRRSAAR